MTLFSQFGDTTFNNRGFLSCNWEDACVGKIMRWWAGVLELVMVGLDATAGLSPTAPNCSPCLEQEVFIRTI